MVRKFILVGIMLSIFLAIPAMAVDTYTIQSIELGGGEKAGASINTSNGDASAATAASKTAAIVGGGTASIATGVVVLAATMIDPGLPEGQMRVTLKRKDGIILRPVVYTNDEKWRNAKVGDQMDFVKVKGAWFAHEFVPHQSSKEDATSQQP